MNTQYIQILKQSLKRISFWIYLLASPTTWLLYISLFGIPKNWVLIQMSFFLAYGIMFLHEQSTVRNIYIPEPRSSMFSIFKICIAFYFKILVIILPLFVVYGFLVLAPSMAKMKIEDGSHWVTMLKMSLFWVPASLFAFSGFIESLKDNKAVSYKRLFSNVLNKLKVITVPLLILFFFNGFAYIRQTSFQLAGITITSKSFAVFWAIADIIPMILMVAAIPSLLVYLSQKLERISRVELPSGE